MILLSTDTTKNKVMVTCIAIMVFKSITLYLLVIYKKWVN
jgi:hypothetical protein